MRRPSVARLLGAAMWLFGTASAVLALQHTFTSRAEAVRLDVLVTAKGQPVLGLTARDFEIRDNGALQQVDFVSFEKIPLNVMLALDMSKSLTDRGLTHLRHAAHGLLDGSSAATRPD